MFSKTKGRHQILDARPLGTFTHEIKARRNLGTHGREDPHHVLDALERTEVGNVGEHTRAIGAARRGGPRGIVRARTKTLRVHEVGDHLDGHITEKAQSLMGGLGQPTRGRGDGIAAANDELGKRLKSRIRADEGNVGAVQGSHDLGPGSPQHLPREECADRVGDRIVHMK